MLQKNQCVIKKIKISVIFHERFIREMGLVLPDFETF